MLLIAAAIAALDPILQVYSWLAGVGTLGIVVLMATTALSVVVYFSRDRGGLGPWRSAIAPVLGLAGLAFAGVAIIVNFPLLVGDVDATGSPVARVLTIALVGLLVLVTILGTLQSFTLRRRAPSAYTDLSR